MELPPISIPEREKIDTMKDRVKSAHASDEDAVEAFKSGRGVFDVDPGSRRLTDFFEKHPRLKQELDPGYAVGFPSIDIPLIGRVYFAYSSTPKH